MVTDSVKIARKLLLANLTKQWYREPYLQETWSLLVSKVPLLLRIHFPYFRSSGTLSGH
jgi:hypothetical protein